MSKEIEEHLLNVAKGMVSAAITAPKGKGINNIQTKILAGNELEEIIEDVKKRFNIFISNVIYNE